MLPRPTTLLVLLAGLATACDRNQVETAAPGPEATLLIVVMDGVRLEESLGDEPSGATGELPSEMMAAIWDELVPLGYRSTNAWNIGSTTTAPAHAAILGGRRLPYANFAIGDDPGLYRPRLPMLHEELQRLGLIQPDGAWMVANTRLIEGLKGSIWTWADGVDVREATFIEADSSANSGNSRESDRATLQHLLSTMDQQPVELALINLHKVDWLGHSGGPEDHPDAVRRLANPIADAWSWVQQDPRYADSTWMLLMADHGRNSVSESEPVYRHHGCQCNGCRRVPFLLLGPGVRAAAEDDTPLLHTDVAPTLAALRGASLPWADGLVRDDLLSSPTHVPSREGLADLALAGQHRAELHYRNDPAHRKELLLDGVEVSSPDAIEVEAPVLAAEGDDAWLCFRELHLAPDQDYTQWAARCLETRDGGGSWQEIEPPAQPVGPWWRPALVPMSDGLMALYPYNPDGLASSNGTHATGTYWIEAAWWDGDSWQVALNTQRVVFPTDMTAAGLDEDVLLVSVAGSTEDTDARYTRAVFTGTLTLGPGGPYWGKMSGTRLDDLQASSSEGWRLEQPTVTLDGEGNRRLAAVAYDDQGTHAVVAWAQDGLDWPERRVVELPGQPLPQLSPVWIDERPAWAVLDAATGLVSVCAAWVDDDPTCVSTERPRVLTLVAAEADAEAVVDRDEGSWEAMTLGLAR